MSIWIRALCTKPLGEVTPDDLRAAVAERLPRIAPLYGEDDHEGSAARLRIEGEAPLLHGKIAYHDKLDPIRFEQPTTVREAVSELRATLEDSDEEGVEDVRELLDRVVEVVAFGLSIEDCEGIGWPVAIAAAAFFAARGEGVIQADGEGWMMPRGLDIEHVLDGD